MELLPFARGHCLECNFLKMIVRALSYFQGKVSRITLSISIRNNEAQISAFLFSLLLQTDQQQRHCRSRNPDRCAIGSSSRPRSTPLEKQLERGKREIYTYIYIYSEEQRKRTRMEASHCHEHQSPSLLLFFVQHYYHSSRKAKERIGYAYTLFETSSSSSCTFHTFQR